MINIEAAPPHLDIVRILGSGGMGVVYEARDRRLHRRVALKVLHSRFSALRDTHELLLAEARLAARVQHKNVVRIYNIHDFDDALCLELEYIDGHPLSNILHTRVLSPAHTVHLLSQTLQALHACHENDVIHGDLKPSNLLITPDGNVHLTDFGVARAVHGGEGSVSASSSLSQSLWGTPAYSPPEAWEGQSASPSWDLYSLGILAYEALVGDLPYSAATPAQLMRAKLEGNRTRIETSRDDLSPGLSDLINSLSADCIENRPGTALEALDAIKLTPEWGTRPGDTESLHVASSVGLTPTPSDKPISRVSRSRNAAPRNYAKRIGVVVALLFVGLLAAGYSVVSRSSDDKPSDHQVPFVEGAGEVGEIQELTVDGDNILYSYDDGVSGRELWATDWDGKSRLVADLNPGKGSSNPSNFLRRPAGGFVFTATTPDHGNELWYCETDPPYARILLEAVPGPMHSNPRPVATWKHLFFFYAIDLNLDGGLWISDGSTDRTGLLHDLVREAVNVDGTNTAVFVEDQAMYFVSTRAEESPLYRLRFEDMSLERLGSVTAGIRDLATVNDVVVFAMQSPDYGYELWRTDDVQKEPRLLRDIWPGTESGNPEDFYVWENEIYFRATSPEFGTELWKTDGTAKGTIQVADIHPGSRHSGPSNFVASNGRLYFRALNDNYGLELWSTTGLPGAPLNTFDVWAGPESSSPYSIAAVGDHLFFSANHPAYGEELWALAVSNVERPPFLVEDIRPGPEGSEPHALIEVSPSKGIFIVNEQDRDQPMLIEIKDGVPVIEPCEALPVHVKVEP